MKTMKWLLRREFWEHKGAFFWTPLVIAAVMLGSVIVTMTYGVLHNGGAGDTIVINGHDMSKAQVFSSAVNAIPQEQRDAFVSMFANGYLGFATPLFLVLTAVAFFYCLGALNDERRDRSILFWKSLPVSDQMTVLSKVLAAICVAPVITIAIAVFTGVILLALMCIGFAIKGINLAGPLLASPELYLSPLRLMALLPVYALWALPTIGWLLMVSAWARSKVFLWAVGTPILVLVLLKWLDFLLNSYGLTIDADWFAHNVVLRSLAGLLPGVWFAFEKVPATALLAPHNMGVDAGSVFAQSYGTLLHLPVWIGAIAGSAMLFAAVQLRRLRGEG